MNPALVSALREAVAPHCEGRLYALIDYPLYLNPGDAAIWLGTRIVLQQTAGAEPAYASTLRGFNAEACRRAIGAGPVFLLGGGSFGAIYRRHHERRLSAISALPGNPVIQLPFSVAGLDDDEALLKRTRDVLRRHGMTTLIARERVSRNLSEACLDQEVALAPDAAHALRLKAAPASAKETWLLRSDLEADGRRVRAPETAAQWDWADLWKLRWINRISKITCLAAPASSALRVMDRIAEKKVRAAAERLGRGRLVVTDRLHGALIAEAIGRRVAAIDNSTRKVSSYMDTWGALLSMAMARSGIAEEGCA